jgi:tetratricopeptide (TPR) repeat protein
MILSKSLPILLSRRVAAALLCALITACGGRGASRVSPAEIPAIELGLEQTPDDAGLRLRYAAALFSGGRCGDARIQAEAAAALQPDNGVTPLIQGQCLEAEGRLSEAVDVYGAYMRQHPDADGVDAVRGRHLLAERALAGARAREALEAESELVDQPGQSGVVAVLPVAILGDTDGEYGPLSGALAQMIISDLSLLDRIRLVERVQLRALLDEMSLAETGRVDTETAARVGRLVRAERLVQGVMVVNRSTLRLEASLIGPDGLEAGAPEVAGSLRRLLDLEKEVALSLADRLAGPLTPSERQEILDNGPESVDAFLRWADGLILEDRGDFAAAANAYQAAARLDPGFVDARTRAQGAASAVTVIGRSPTEVVGLGAVAARAASGVANPGLDRALRGAIFDVASLSPELATGLGPAARGVQSPGANQPNPILPIDVLLRVLVRIPR